MKTPVIASASEAIHSFFSRRDGLLRGACHPAALRADRVARNDGCAPAHACGRECEGNGGGGRKGGLGSRQAPAVRPAIIQ